MFLSSVTLMCACLVQTIHGYSFRTQIPVFMPEPEIVDIAVYLSEAEVARYTDEEKRLTAIKDKKLNACFLNDFDPQWNLNREEKEDMMKNNEFNNTDNIYELEKTTGHIIAKMCLRKRLYWLCKSDESLLPPPPLLRTNGQIPGRRDEPTQSSVGVPRPPPKPQTNIGISQPIMPQRTDDVSSSQSNVDIPPPFMSQSNVDIPPPFMSQSNVDIPPPFMSQSNVDIPPPLMSQNNVDIPPPLMSQSNVDIPPPLMSQNNVDIPPPLMSQSNVDIPPPLMSQSNVDIPPPLMSQSKGDIPPPLMSQSNGNMPVPLVAQSNFNVPPPLISQNTVPHRPETVKLGRRMLKKNDNSVLVNSQNTLAPPTPDFNRHPQFMMNNSNKK